MRYPKRYKPLLAVAAYMAHTLLAVYVGFVIMTCHWGYRQSNGQIQRALVIYTPGYADYLDLSYSPPEAVTEFTFTKEYPVTPWQNFEEPFHAIED